MDQQPPPAPHPADEPPPPAPGSSAPGSSAPVPPAPAPVPAPAGEPPSWNAAVVQAGPAPGVEFAGFGARAIAYILDSILLSLVIGALSIVLLPIIAGTSRDGDVSAAGGAASAVWVVLIILVSLLYFPFFWQRSGRTPAMGMVNIKVVRDSDGGPITWGRAVLRYIGFFIDSIVFGLPIGWLWPLFDKRRRAWHDLIGGTVVIKS